MPSERKEVHIDAPDNLWSTALPDWEDRIRDGRTLIPELPLHTAYADKAVRIFRRLRVPDLIGRPTFGEICEPWVLEFVRAIFGCYDPETKARALQEFFLLVPKKNGKSAISAGIMVTAVILNERPSAEYLLISETQHISGISFVTAKGIIAGDPDLAAIFNVQDHKKTITHIDTNATLKILSADGDVVTGSKAAGVLIDEAHVLGSKAKAPGVYLELRGGLASRPEGFFLQISTQSKDEPKGQFKKELLRARAVRDGSFNTRLLPVLYEFPQDMAQSGAWRDPATWAMVNPNLDRSVSLEFLIERYEAAKAEGPESEALFASQHLNVEIGMGLHSERWVGADFWPSCAEPGLTLDRLLARSDVAVVGGDIGGADDLLGLAVIGREIETRRWLAWCGAWCLPGVLEKRKEIAPRLLDLAAAGDLVIDGSTERHVQDVADICDIIRDFGLFPASGAIGLDPWGVEALTDELVRRGYHADQIRGVGQGFKLNGAVKGLERRLVDGTLVHGDQPLMRWVMGNAKAETRGNNVLITKERAGVAKIDPLIALFNATMLMALHPVAAGHSYLNDEEMMVL